MVVVLSLVLTNDLDYGSFSGVERAPPRGLDMNDTHFHFGDI